LPQPVPALGVIVRLSELLEDSGKDMHKLTDLNITGLTADSRAVEPGYLFAALPGSKADGRAFIAEAVTKGASAILAPDGTAVDSHGVQVITDANPRRTFARLAAKYYGAQPEITVAVTGTNGKTSVAHFVKQIWQHAGYPAATLGTLGVTSTSGDIPGSLTTPDPVSLHQTLAKLAEQGIDHLAMEASSHGLDQYRLDGVRVSAAGFTNLTRDHLDYHGTMEAYLAAKLRLFSDVLVPGGVAVVNADSQFCDTITEACQARGICVITYGREGRAIQLLDVTPTGAGQVIDVVILDKHYRITVPLAGSFQVMNALCAAGLALASGIDAPAAVSALENLKGVPGRLELVGSRRNGASVYVDYAHTPDALETALTALRPHTSKRLAIVFGAGGDRDAGKRPLMGRAAADHADDVYVTDDNPRSENAASIRAQIIAACSDAKEISDRAEAIETAIASLRSGDTLLIAGKGHETGQIIGDTVLPFDDRATALKSLDQLDQMS
jgi:UDP-N-acetylmuramoyl-L-alanyl-D-glutamate--2,6-diaminopimelate ligase